MNPLLRTAVIGTGFVGPHHVDAVRRGGYAEVVAIAGSDPARTAERARSLSVPRATTDVAALMTDSSIDVVHICTPNASHVDLARAALEGGKHVVVEKPLALSVDDADGLVALASEHGLHGAVAFTYRGYPTVRQARSLAAAGKLGDVRLVHGSYLQDWLVDASDYNWRVELAAGGPSRALADIGSHWFDTAEFVSGQRIDMVMADLATFMTTRHKPTSTAIAFQEAGGAAAEVSVESEDAATFLVRFVGGGRGSAVVSQVSPGHKNAFSLEVSGSLRSIGWRQEDPNHLWIGSRGHEGSALLPREPDPAGVPGVPSLPAGHPEGWSEALRDLFRPFYAAIARGDPPDGASGATDDRDAYPTLADGARAVRFVEAALRSARTGTWASLD